MHAPAATSAAEKNSTCCGNHPRKPDLLVGMYATANCASYATVTAEEKRAAMKDGSRKAKTTTKARRKPAQQAARGWTAR